MFSLEKTSIFFSRKLSCINAQSLYKQVDIKVGKRRCGEITHI